MQLNKFINHRGKKFLMRFPFIREISQQIEKRIDSFCAKLDFKAKLLLISDIYSLKNVFKHKATKNSLITMALCRK